MQSPGRFMGAGAVISTLGPTSNRPELTVSRGMPGILAEMKRHGVRRLIVTAGAGIGDAEDAPTVMSRSDGCPGQDVRPERLRRYAQRG